MSIHEPKFPKRLNRKTIRLQTAATSIRRVRLHFYSIAIYTYLTHHSEWLNVWKEEHANVCEKIFMQIINKEDIECGRQRRRTQSIESMMMALSSKWTI